MVIIYVLVNPLDNQPFYVGSTQGTLKDRMSMHLTNLFFTFKMSESVRRKVAIILGIQYAGMQPIIKPIFYCSKDVATNCEKAAYHLLLSKGYELHQLSNRFKVAR